MSKFFNLPHASRFMLPCDGFRDLELGEENIVVITIFGKSDLRTNGFKSSSLECMFGTNLFGRESLKDIPIDKETLVGVEGYYNPAERLVFLHLLGPFDVPVLIQSLSSLGQKVQEKGFLSVWSDLRYHYARTLLLLFCMSHIMLLCHPSHIFDVSYIQLFRTLDAIRLKSIPFIGDILKGVRNISKDWQNFGRFCSPRVLFIFSSKTIPLHVLEGADVGSEKQSRLERSSPLRKLELELEYQIYRLLRKCRVITNISSNSLFAIPNNQPFVFVLEESHRGVAPRSIIGDVVWDICKGTDTLVSNFNNLVVSSGIVPTNMSSSNFSMVDEVCSSVTCLSDITDASHLSDTLLSSVSVEKKRNLAHSFSLFLKQHTDQALSRGFDDNFVRHSGHEVLYEMPALSVWFIAFHALHKFLVSVGEEEESKEHLISSAMRSHLDTDIRFSDHLCAKALPYAISAYKEGLPLHYTRAQHEEKVQLALAVLSGQARGPMIMSYIRQLEEACLCIWNDGRIGCETLSLRGSTCQHPKHTTAGFKEQDTSSSTIPCMNHNSEVVFVAYCNCGHNQGQMDDPFTLRAANFDYYQKMVELCCFQLDSREFPTFRPSVQDAKAANVKTNLETSSQSTKTIDIASPTRSLHSESQQSSPDMIGVLQHTLAVENLSQGRMEARDENPDMEEGDVIFTVEKEDNENDNGEEKTETVRDLFVSRQASTTEYLPGMLTTLSPSGLLPQFSSWSLVCLGPSSLYSHNAGICDQPGFLSGTNFLLPWDVTIKIRDKSTWPAIADSMGKKGFMLKNKKHRMGDVFFLKGDVNEFNVKIFLGTEYQCMRGHRFMMAAADKPLKASSVGHVKDTAIKIAQSDMPLYYPCPCSRGINIVMGQLMRLHVVTPKAPVNVTLNPIIQPAPDPCPRFVPQPTSFSPIKLSASAYWILRLPLVYGDDSGSKYYPPGTRQGGTAAFAKLIKGCYGISEIALDR